MGRKGCCMKRPSITGSVLIVTFAVMLAGCSLVERLETSMPSAAGGEVEPAGFTGTLGDIGDECGVGVSVEVVDGVRKTRSYCSTQSLTASDPRLTGTYTRFVNVDEYLGGHLAPDGVSLRASRVTHQIRNDGGVWLGDATASITVEDAREGGEDSRSPQVVVFTGSDGYEGLTAIAWWQPQSSDPEVRGVIIPDLLPPPPPAAALFEILPAESTTELHLTHPDPAFRVDDTLY